MAEIRPVILVPSAVDDEQSRLYARQPYCDALIKAGALPVLMPATAGACLAGAYINMCSGVLIMGGVDVDARLYGEANRVYNGRISPQRDALETCVVKKAAQARLPLLGICRGAQILNIAMGGTLYQDIYAQKGAGVFQHSQNAPEWHHTHSVKTAAGSWLYKVTGREELQVNSMHHQAVKDIAPGFEAVCFSGDGIIEAIESADRRMIGVQWHPELMREQEQEAIFAGFVRLCAE